MSLTVVAIDEGVIDLTRTRRANQHPDWCTGLLSCKTDHIGPATRGRSWYLHGEKPEMRWTLEPKEAIDGSQARVEGMLSISNRYTDEGFPAVALFECTAWDARAMAADLVKVAERIEAAEVSR